MKALVRGETVNCKTHKEWRVATLTNPCKRCGKPPVNGHDACIAGLPGVEFACCGHGKRERAYIAFTNGTVVRGFDVIEKWKGNHKVFVLK